MEQQYIGKYRIVRLLGKGAMGSVYECMHASIERRFAIKVLHPSLVQNLEVTMRFFNEARASNRVGHPGMVEVFDCDRLADGTSLIVMEFVEGKTLRQRLRELGSGMPAESVVRLAWYIADTLSAAHEKKIIHRDLKPENVMLLRDPQAPGGERIKLLDFGIAKLGASEHGDALETQQNTFMGTPAYMSPEQCRDAGKVDEKADVYSFGVTLYQMLTGRLPFPSQNAAELIGMHLFQPPPPLKDLAPATPDALSALVHSMLEKDKDRRPTMKQAAEAFLPLMAQYPAPSVGPASTQHPVIAPVSSPGIHAGPSSQPSLPSNPQVQSTLGGSTGQSTTIPERRPRWLVPVGLLFGVAASLAAAFVLLPRQRSAPSVVPEAAVAQPLPASAAESPTAVPKRVRWSLTSEPAGAAIFDADHSRIGTTPFVREQPATAASETLIVRAAGFVDRSITLDHTHDVEMHVKLQRRLAARPLAKSKARNDAPAPLPIMP